MYKRQDLARPEDADATMLALCDSVGRRLRADGKTAQMCIRDRSCAATSNEQRVRVEVFSKISATFLPRSVSCGMPALFLAFSSAARSSR